MEEETMTSRTTYRQIVKDKDDLLWFWAEQSSSVFSRVEVDEDKFIGNFMLIEARNADEATRRLQNLVGYGHLNEEELKDTIFPEVWDSFDGDKGNDSPRIHEEVIEDYVRSYKDKVVVFLHFLDGAVWRISNRPAPEYVNNVLGEDNNG